MPYTEPARDLGRRQLAYAFKQSRDVSSIVGVLGELECTINFGSSMSYLNQATATRGC